MTKPPRAIDRARDAERLLRKQRKAFIRKFGREPTEADPVFFDPAAPGPDPVALDQNAIRALAIESMTKAGTPPQFIYAYVKTGLILSDELRDTYPADVRAEYDAALREYFELEDDGRGDH